MEKQVGLKDYIILRNRFDKVVDKLTKKKKTEEADYHMIYFFLFFNDYEKLNAYIADSEKMIKKGGF